MTHTHEEPQDTHVPTGTDYVSDRRFADFPISSDVLRGIHELGYEHATPVQSATIEPALAGKDMLVRAKTGTGKTTAFCLPIIERIEDGTRKPSALVLAPTRELAQQIAEEAAGLARYRDISIATLVGGLALGPQEKDLEQGAELIVGTPGRVLDHLRRKTLDPSNITMVCLDEADEMVSQGFYEDVTKIIDKTPDGRQVLLFSATISDDTQRLVDAYLDAPEDIRLSTDGDNVELVEHVLYETDPAVHKVRSLLFLLDTEDPTSAIIFCNTREDTATVASFLDRQGLDVQLLSGELSQARRTQVMKKVKSGAVRFLVSTDVAARGIDISDLSHVINYSLPQDASVYLHRSGRTGRIGKNGTCISLVGGSDLATRNQLVNVHKIKFTTKELPDAETASRTRVERQAEQIRNAMGTMVFESYLPTVRALKERPDGDALLAAALRIFFQWNRQRRIAEGDLDTIEDLQRERNARLERKESRGRKGRGERSDRGDRGDRGDRRDRDDRRGRKGGRRDEEGAAELDDLDALLSADSVAPASEEEGGAKRKRKRRKKKRGGEGAEASEGATVAASDDADDDAPAEAAQASDDLLDDALLVEDAPAEKPKRKRSPRKKAEAPPPEAELDDLDALLSAD
ncbi:MAG: DEAD/DEAH box helicase [Alphaproteobacteria bacterium]|nr:DEAD/DEAH box helicase [Alphaproteobacteria bacterium]